MQKNMKVFMLGHKVVLSGSQWQLEQERRRDRQGLCIIGDAGFYLP